MSSVPSTPSSPRSSSASLSDVSWESDWRTGVKNIFDRVLGRNSVSSKESARVGTEPLQRELSRLAGKLSPSDVLCEQDKRALALQRMVAIASCRAQTLQADFLSTQEGNQWRKRQTMNLLARIGRLEEAARAAEAQLEAMREESATLRKLIADQDAIRRANLALDSPRAVRPKKVLHLQSRAMPTPTTPISPRRVVNSTFSDEQLRSASYSNVESLGTPGACGGALPAEAAAGGGAAGGEGPAGASLQTSGTVLRAGILAMRTAVAELTACGSGGGLRCELLITCFESGLLRLLQALGSGMALAAQNDARNVKKLRALLPTVGHAATVRELLSHEIRAGVHTPSPPPKGAVLGGSSAAIGLTWLLRSLHFAALLMKALGGDGDAKPATAMGDAYRRALQPYHGWLMQSVFQRAAKSAPAYDEVTKRLCPDAAARDAAAAEDLCAFADCGLQLVAALNATLAELQLTDLRKV